MIIITGGRKDGHFDDLTSVDDSIFNIIEFFIKIFHILTTFVFKSYYIQTVFFKHYLKFGYNFNLVHSHKSAETAM